MEDHLKIKSFIKKREGAQESLCVETDAFDSVNFFSVKFPFTADLCCEVGLCFLVFSQRSSISTCSGFSEASSCCCN